jgi:hypothetical protein
MFTMAGTKIKAIHGGGHNELLRLHSQVGNKLALHASGKQPPNRTCSRLSHSFVRAVIAMFGNSATLLPAYAKELRASCCWPPLASWLPRTAYHPAENRAPWT